MKEITVLVIFTLCFACAASAAEELSLEEAITSALGESLSADAANIEEKYGDVAMAEGVAGVIPDMSLYSSKSGDSISDLGPGGSDHSIGFSISVDTGAFLADVKSSAVEKKYYVAGAGNSRAELVLNVEKSYYNFAQSDSLLNSAKASCERAANNYEVVSRRYELGDTNKVELLRAEANLLSAEKELLSAESALVGANRELCDIIGDDEWRAYIPQTIPDPEGNFGETPDSNGDGESGIDPDKYGLKGDDESQYGEGVNATDLLPGPLSLISGLGRGNTYSWRYDDNPEIRELRYKVEMSTMDYRAAWTRLLPKTTLSIATAERSSLTNPDDSAYGTEYQVMIIYDIANLKDVVLGINRARLERDSAELEIKMKRQEISRNIADSADALDTAYLNWETMKKNVELTEEAYRLTARGYELGNYSLADLLDTESEFYEAEQALAQAKSEYWSNYAELNYLLGVSMEVR